jgi:hypothetical protein
MCEVVGPIVDVTRTYSEMERDLRSITLWNRHYGCAPHNAHLSGELTTVRRAMFERIDPLRETGVL